MQACTLHAESPQGYVFCGILKLICTAKALDILFNDLKYVHTSTHAFLCKIKFSLLPVCVMLNQDNQPIPRIVYPLFCLSHADCLFKLPLVFLHRRNIFCFLL